MFFDLLVKPCLQVRRRDYMDPEMEDADLGMEGDPVSRRSYYMEGPEKHGREPPVSTTKSNSGKKVECLLIYKICFFLIFKNWNLVHYNTDVH